MINISVIIPVYKAEKFLEKAVASVLQQPEVKEILLIEDGSPDNSLQLCQSLAEKHQIITLLQHEKGQNRGASASRNLGMKRAKYPYIAFLDADDHYLPNRFRAENRIFTEDSTVDGVYGALGFYYYDKEQKERMEKMFDTNLTTVTEKLSPKKLKYALLNMFRSNKGYFALDTLTINKKLAEKVSYISEAFDLHEDTHFIIKLSFLGKLVPGVIDQPVGMRGVHENNRITSSRNNAFSKFLMYENLENWVNSTIKDEQLAKRFIRKDRMVYQLLGDESPRVIKALKMFNLFITEPFSYHIEYSFNLLVYGVFGPKVGKYITKGKKRLYDTLLQKNAKKWDRIIYAGQYH